ncbi:hypothetical protein J6590_030570 [Homalodisca vitripennis]|nr:hypothetical protein J6590_030570 [Homalodisca vitripennis]
MLERVVLVRVREQDLTIIEELLEPAKDRYKEKVGRRVKIVVDSSRYLAPSCLGGVELATPNRKVRVINTFLSRLQLIVKQLVPAIRRHLFEQGPLSRHESRQNMLSCEKRDSFSIRLAGRRCPAKVTENQYSSMREIHVSVDIV